MKFPNVHIVWTAGKNLALPDTLSRNTPPELLTRKTTIKTPQNIKFYIAKDETSPRLQFKYAVETTFKKIPYSPWIKNITQQNRIKQQPHRKDPFPLMEKENLTDIINLSGPLPKDLKYTINQIFNLHDPLDTIPLSKLEVENIFLPATEKITLELLQKYQNLDPVIRQLNHGTNTKLSQPKLIPQC